MYCKICLVVCVIKVVLVTLTYGDYIMSSIQRPVVTVVSVGTKFSYEVHSYNDMFSRTVTYDDKKEATTLAKNFEKKFDKEASRIEVAETKDKYFIMEPLVANGLFTKRKALRETFDAVGI